MAIEIAVQIASSSKTLPTRQQLCSWIKLALANRANQAEITIRIVDEPESAALNSQYRHKTGPTNVLSFPYEPMPGDENSLCGDIVICAPVIAAEAQQQHKTLWAHWAHIVIHGVLHLLGFNHELPEEAVVMESLETDFLVKLGFPPPYGATLIS